MVLVRLVKSSLHGMIVLQVQVVYQKAVQVVLQKVLQVLKVVAAILQVLVAPVLVPVLVVAVIHQAVIPVPAARPIVLILQLPLG